MLKFLGVFFQESTPLAYVIFKVRDLSPNFTLALLLLSFLIMLGWSAETCGVISRSPHPQTGEHKSRSGPVKLYLFLLLKPTDFLCLCPYDLEWHWERKLHVLWWDYSWREKEMNKLSCICLLYTKVPYKQSLMLINIQSCRNDTINVCTKLLITGAAFTINALTCWGGWWWTDPEIRLKF